MKIRSFLPLAAALVSALAFAAPAFANDARPSAGEHAKHGHRFPMQGAEFKARMEKRLAHAKERLEKHLAKGNVSAERAKELRAKLDATAAQLRAEADKAAADGVVTKEEAKEIRRTAKALRHHHGRGHRR